MHAKSRNLWIAAGVAVAVIALAVLMLPADDEDPGARSADTADKGAGEEPGSGMPDGHPPVSTETVSDGPPASGDVASVDPDGTSTLMHLPGKGIRLRTRFSRTVTSCGSARRPA